MCLNLSILSSRLANIFKINLYLKLSKIFGVEILLVNLGYEKWEFGIYMNSKVLQWMDDVLNMGFLCDVCCLAKSSSFLSLIFISCINLRILGVAGGELIRLGLVVSHFILLLFLLFDQTVRVFWLNSFHHEFVNFAFDI